MITSEVNFRGLLFAHQDFVYRDFHKTISTASNLIGVRCNVLRDLSKKIAKDDYEKYFSFEHKYYEEIIIHGMVIGYLKIDFEKKLQLLNDFLPMIDNWAVCDSVCSTIKDFKKNQELGYQYILNLLESDMPFTVRVGFVLLLNYYVNDEYIDKAIDLIKKFNYEKDHYYIQMAIAWLISFCFIKYPDKTMKLFKDKQLPKFVHNKAISKCCDSFRVTKELKDEIRLYRMK